MSSFRIFILVACIPVFLIKLSAWRIAKQQCREELGQVTSDMDRKDVIKREKCYKACEMKKVGTMTANGEYNLQYVIDQIPADEKYYKLFVLKLKECAAESHGEDDCETAFELYTCFEKIWAPNEWQRTLNVHKFMYATDLEKGTAS